LLKTYNKNIKIIFTLSPVRHWKDGAIDNHVSKSQLLLGIINNLNAENYYFPSYEIVNDDLRDYRYYKKDLIHPNEIAVEYIWEKLSNAMFGEETLIEMKMFESINNARNHRPRNVKSKQHQKFLDEIIEKAVDLKLKYPRTNIDEDIKYFKNQQEEN